MNDRLTNVLPDDPRIRLRVVPIQARHDGAETLAMPRASSDQAERSPRQRLLEASPIQCMLPALAIGMVHADFARALRQHHRLAHSRRSLAAVAVLLANAPGTRNQKTDRVWRPKGMIDELRYDCGHGRHNLVEIDAGEQ